MLALIALLVSLKLAIDYHRGQVLFAFWFFCTLSIYLLGLDGIEAAYQINSKPSDTKLYHDAFNARIDNIGSYLFYQYPLYLRIIIYPFENAYFALIAQSLMFSAAVLWLLRQSHILIYALIFINHAVIYLNVNFFKDNLFLIAFIFSAGLISRLSNKLVNSGVIASTLVSVSAIRPFSLLFVPLAGIPFMFGSMSRIIKGIFWLIALGGLIGILVTQWTLITYVASHWSDDASVGTTGFSAASLPKIVLGPTPFHYLFFDGHFVQPFLENHAILFTVLHLVYYFFFALFIVFFFCNLRMWLRLLFKSPASLFLLGVGVAVMVVYMIAYGSADIRQRAVILTLIFSAFSLPFIESGEIFQSQLNGYKFPLLVSLFLTLFIVSIIAI